MTPLNLFSLRSPRFIRVALSAWVLAAIVSVRPALANTETNTETTEEATAETGASDAPADAPNPAIQEPQRKTETRVHLDLSDRRLSVYMDNEVVANYTVAVGKAGWETPIGNYSITHMAIDPIWENPWTGELVYPGPGNPMGRAVVVFHTNADGTMIAFHGTPQEDLLGQAVSHGCVRMRNEDILAMYEIIRYGTAVTVVP